ncbi:hypothetical protein P692DRAFT_20834477, partial [Suillus brevipes Sb2]
MHSDKHSKLCCLNPWISHFSQGPLAIDEVAYLWSKYSNPEQTSWNADKFSMSDALSIVESRPESLH